MGTTLFAFAVVAGAIWYFLTDMERWRFRRTLTALVKRARTTFADWHSHRDPLIDVLRERTRWILAVPALVAINVLIFAQMLFGATPAGDPETLIAWGANFGPRTTNGEWWRLVSSVWVHDGIVPLAINTAALLTAGRILERLVGTVTFVAVYLVAALLASVATLWISPVGVGFGASGAIFAMYGLLLACWMWGAFQRESTTVRLATVKRLAIPAALFVLYHLVTSDLATNAETAGLVAGFVAGLLLTRSSAHEKPSLVRLAATVGTVMVIAGLSAEPLRGLVDARPEIARVIQSEENSLKVYDAAVARFQKGRATARELAVLIEKTIVPELVNARKRVGSLGHVPQEHREMVAAAQKFLRLREDGWRFRAKALHKSSGAMLREADRKEQSAREAFDELVSVSTRTPWPKT